MALEPKTTTEGGTEKTKVDYSDRLETSVSTGTQTTLEPDGKTVTTQKTSSDTAEFDRDGNLLSENDGSANNVASKDAQPGEEGDGASTGDDTTGGELDAAGGPSPDAPEPLPDYDPENAEVSEAYDKRYFTEAGTLNQDAIGAEFWASFKAADGDLSKAGLSEGTYKYLEGKLGITKEFAKRVESGLVADQVNREVKFFEGRGGINKFKAAVAWAAKGGYSKEQIEKFRTVQSKGFEDGDYADAADLLVARFDRASGGGRPAGGNGKGRPQRQFASSPQRDAGTGGGTQGAVREEGRTADTFSSHAEYQKAFAAALKTKDDKIIEDVRRRGRISTYGRTPQR